jgi:hypothetical protein
MLRELPDVPQIAGEPRRRWFFCQELDLVVWEDVGGTIRGFQLAYDKHRAERSICWRQGCGFAHYAVDGGESRAGENRTPLLVADGPFQREQVLPRFLALAGEVPDGIVAFVARMLADLCAAD